MSASNSSHKAAATIVVLPPGVYTQPSTSSRRKASISVAPQPLHPSRTLPAIFHVQPDQHRLNSFPLTSSSILHPQHQHQNFFNPYNHTSENQHAESYELSTILQRNPNIVLARHSGPIKWSSASPQKDEFGLEREEQKERHELGFCGCAGFEHVKELFGRMMRRDANGLGIIEEESEGGEEGEEEGKEEEMELQKIQPSSIPPLRYPETGNKRWSI